MAKTTTAIGILFETLGVDKALRKVNNYVKGVDSLSSSFDDATENATKLIGAFEKGKGGLFGRMFTAGAARSAASLWAGLKGVSKGMLAASGDTDDFITSIGNLAGAIPVIGPLIKGTTDLLFKMLEKFGSLSDEQTRWALLTTEGITGVSADLSKAANQVGLTSDAFMKLSRSMGTSLQTGRELTQQTQALSTAFGVSTDEMAQYTKGMHAAGYAINEVSALGDEFVDAMKKYDLQDLMQDVPEIMDMTRTSAMLLGKDLKGRVGPAVMGVAKSAAIMQKVIGLTPKKALEISKKTLGSFQELATNIEYVFTGLEDDFDPRSKRIMEMFVRSGQGMRQSLSAIQKAASGDLGEIAKSFEQVLTKGGMGAKRMRLGLQKEFGPEFTKVIAGLTPKGKKMYAELYGPLEEAGGADIATKSIGAFDAFTKQMVEGAGQIKQQLAAVSEEFMSTMMRNLPKTKDQVLGILSTLKKEAINLKETLDKSFTGKDDDAAQFVAAMHERFKPMLEDLAKAVKGAIGPSLDGIVSGLTVVGDIFKGVSTVFKAVQAGFSKLLDWLGLTDTAAQAETERRGKVVDAVTSSDYDPAVKTEMLRADLREQEIKKLENDLKHLNNPNNMRFSPPAAVKQRVDRVTVTLEALRVDQAGSMKIIEAARSATSRTGPAPR